MAKLDGSQQTGDGLEVTVRYLTPHSKWSIHSEYQDNLFMLSLSRGGPEIWMSPQDAEAIGVKDNEWIESYNRNGVVAARAIVSHRMPKGTVYVPFFDEGVFMAVLPRAHQLYFMVARAQAFDHALHGNGDTIDFGRVGFRDHGDAERAACRRHLLTDDFRALHADHFQRR